MSIINQGHRANYHTSENTVARIASRAPGLAYPGASSYRTEKEAEMYSALEISYGSGARGEVVRTWIEGNMLAAVEAGRDVSALPALAITVNDCGSHVEYRMIEDVPLEDVPCSCGKPEHWFIKYVEAEATQ